MLLRAAAALACAAAAVHAFTLPVPSLRRHGRSALRARAVDEFVVKRLEQVRDLHPPPAPSLTHPSPRCASTTTK